MTFMLASVTGVEEAEIAIRHGADIVDLKDVGSGFGAVAHALVRATVDAEGTEGYEDESGFHVGSPTFKS